MLPDLDPDLGTLGAGAVYAIVLGFVFVESGLLLGFFLPGDTILFGAGLVSAEEGSGVHLGWLVAGAFTAAVLGDSVGYATGSRLGRSWLDHRVEAGRMDPRHLRRAERFYQRYGWWAVVTARWIPWVRTFTPVLAGTSRMGYPRFLSANVVGALVWAVGLEATASICQIWLATVPGFDASCGGRLVSELGSCRCRSRSAFTTWQHPRRSKPRFENGSRASSVSRTASSPVA